MMHQPSQELPRVEYICHSDYWVVHAESSLNLSPVNSPLKSPSACYYVMTRAMSCDTLPLCWGVRGGGGEMEVRACVCVCVCGVCV